MTQLIQTKLNIPRPLYGKVAKWQHGMRTMLIRHFLAKADKIIAEGKPDAIRALTEGRFEVRVGKSDGKTKS